MHTGFTFEMTCSWHTSASRASTLLCSTCSVPEDHLSRGVAYAVGPQGHLSRGASTCIHGI